MEKKYDVFISCKSEDYGYAEEVYNFLNSNGVRTFLASKELRKMGDSEYRSAIMQALDSAYHLIIFASNPAYIESKWVFYEWDTFVNAKLNGRKDGQIMTILKGFNTDKLCLDLIKYESFTFEKYKDRLLSYVETPESRRIKDQKRRQEESFRQQAAIEAQKRIEEEKLARIRDEEYKKALAVAHRKEERIRRNAEEKARKEAQVRLVIERKEIEEQRKHESLATRKKVEEQRIRWQSFLNKSRIQPQEKKYFKELKNVIREFLRNSFIQKLLVPLYFIATILNGIFSLWGLFFLYFFVFGESCSDNDFVLAFSFSTCSIAAIFFANKEKAAFIKYLSLLLYIGLIAYNIFNFCAWYNVQDDWEYIGMAFVFDMILMFIYNLLYIILPEEYI